MTTSMNDQPAQADAAEPTIFPCTHCGKRLRAPAESAGRRLKCPQCGQVVRVPEPALEADVVIDETLPAARGAFALGNLVTACVMTAVLAGCAVYANLSFA